MKRLLQRDLHVLFVLVISSEISLAGDLPTEPLQRFNWPAPFLSLDCRPELDTFLECLGEKAGLWGNALTGVEAWIYPFKLASSITLEYPDGQGSRGRHQQIYRHTAIPYLSQVHLKDKGSSKN